VGGGGGGGGGGVGVFLVAIIDWFWNCYFLLQLLIKSGLLRDTKSLSRSDDFEQQQKI
jgi:hypothetical protein